ncbi:MAG: universal stress protein, partial [bacterium]
QTPLFSDMVEIVEYIDNDKQYYLEQFKKLRKLAGNIKIETQILIGHAAEQIIKFSKENKIDIIVVGRKGKSKLEDFIIGSVSRRLAAYSPCTVIIVK